MAEHQHPTQPRNKNVWCQKIKVHKYYPDNWQCNLPTLIFCSKKSTLDTEISSRISGDEILAIKINHIEDTFKAIKNSLDEVKKTINTINRKDQYYNNKILTIEQKYTDKIAKLELLLSKFQKCLE